VNPARDVRDDAVAWEFHRRGRPWQLLCPRQSFHDGANGSRPRQRVV